MLGQIRALVELRLLLLKRLWLQSTSGVLASVLVGLIVVMLALVAVGMGIGLFVAGWRVFSDADSRILVLAVDVMVFATFIGWGVGLLSEIQRSDAIDFRKMLYLPVSLPMVFLLNFIASLASPLTLFFALGTLGFVWGLTIGAGPRMLGGFVLAGAFYLMLAAWCYHIRGLLAILMENKRRRRLVLTLIPLVIIAVAQVPQILVHVGRHSAGVSRHHSQSDTSGDEAARPAGFSVDTLARRLILANGVVPLGWLPLGVAALREGRYGAVALCLIGMTGLAGAGLAAGYRSTRRHYTGAGRRRKEKDRPRVEAARPVAPPLTARTLPFVSDDTAALTWAGVLSLMRHPTVRVQLLMPVFIIFVILLPIVFGAPDDEPAPSFVVGFLVYVVMINAAMLIINIFGLDPEAFQALVLLPTDRRQYFLAMNLAYFLPVAAQSILFATAGSFVFRPGAITLTILLLQFVQVYVSLCVGGNFMSIYFPFRVRRDALSGRKGRPAALVAALLAFLGVPLLMIPTVVAFAADQVAARWLPPVFAPLGIVLSLAFLVLSSLVYRQCLPVLGRRLQAREQEILLALRRDKD